jgi:hypothetical protein
MSGKTLHALIQNGRYIVEEAADQRLEGKRVKLVVAEEDDPTPKVKAMIRIPKSKANAPEFQKLTPEQVHEAMAAYARENAGITDRDLELQEAALEAIQEEKL